MMSRLGRTPPVTRLAWARGGPPLSNTGLCMKLANGRAVFSFCHPQVGVEKHSRSCFRLPARALIILFSLTLHPCRMASLSYRWRCSDVSGGRRQKRQMQVARSAPVAVQAGPRRRHAHVGPMQGANRWLAGRWSSRAAKRRRQRRATAHPRRPEARLHRRPAAARTHRVGHEDARRL